MDDRLDHILASLASAPPPPGLAQLDAAVLGRIAGRRPGRRLDGALLGATALAAVVMGVAGAMPPGRAHVAHPMTMLASAYALAPSTLLDGDRFGGDRFGDDR